MTGRRPSRVVLVFVDGLGAGSREGAINPLARLRLELLSNFSDEPAGKPLPFGGVFAPLDAALGVDGLPQSATGQTALLTGVNAPQNLGRHLFGFPNEPLRQILNDMSVLKRIERGARSARFANTFRPLFFELPPERMIRRLSVTTVATLAAKVPFFRLSDLRAGNSLYHDFTNQYLIDRGFDVALRTPVEAGRILAGMSENIDFLLYEYFLTDRAGHAQNAERAIDVLRDLDLFLRTVLDSADLGTTRVVVASDHGNIENLSFRGHTANPAQCLVFGPRAQDAAASLERLTDVTPLILRELGLS